MIKILFIFLLFSTSFASENKILKLPDEDITVLDQHIKWDLTIRMNGKTTNKKIGNAKELLFSGKSWVCTASEASTSQVPGHLEPIRSISCFHMKEKITSTTSVFCDQKNIFCSGLLISKDPKEEVTIILISVPKSK
jgi:hypothetical protein